MFKKNLSAMLLLIIFTTCLAVEQDFAKQSVEKIIDENQQDLQVLTRNDYFKEFSKKIKSSKVTYDGKNLKLYLDTGEETKACVVGVVIALAVALSLFLTMKPHDENSKNYSIFYGTLCLLMGLVPMARIIINLCRETSPTPLLTINTDSIESSDGIKSKWIDASVMTFLSDKSIILCNKYGKPVFIFDQKHLPLSFSELITLVEFCLKEYGAK